MSGFSMKFVAVSSFIVLFSIAPLAHAAGKPTPKAPRPAKTTAKVFRHTVAMDGLLPVHVDKNDGRILVTLPPAQADGISARFLYATAL
ncbi:MAG: hypothetical protein WBW61_01300, partial [Rhodanobacteraceae bacterium]